MLIRTKVPDVNDHYDDEALSSDNEYEEEALVAFMAFTSQEDAEENQSELNSTEKKVTDTLPVMFDNACLTDDLESCYSDSEKLSLKNLPKEFASFYALKNNLVHENTQFSVSSHKG